MKFFFIFYLLSELSYSQSEIFGTINGNVDEIVYSSSFWLSGSPSVNPTTKNRLIIQSGLSSVFMIDNENIFNYPNLDVGLKVSKNLSFTCKSYGFHSGDENPQILGGGIQYFYGEGDTLDWSTSFQRIDVKGLKYFSLTSMMIDFQKWFLWNHYKFRIGLGSNFFKQFSTSKSSNFPSIMKGQINFISFEMIIPISIFALGINTRIAPRRGIVTVYIQKEFF